MLPPMAPEPYKTLPPPGFTVIELNPSELIVLKSVWPNSWELILIPFQTTAVCEAVVPLKEGEEAPPNPFSLK